MQHKGAILEKAVRLSGISLASLSSKLNKSRRWIYDAFENPNLNIEYILQIGKIIHYDFTDEIDEISARKNELNNTNNVNFQLKAEETADFWKEKYIMLLEKYNGLLEKFSD